MYFVYYVFISHLSNAYEALLCGRRHADGWRWESQGKTVSRSLMSSGKGKCEKCDHIAWSSQSHKPVPP